MHTFIYTVAFLLKRKQTLTIQGMLWAGIVHTVGIGQLQNSLVKACYTAIHSSHGAEVLLVFCSCFFKPKTVQYFSQHPKEPGWVSGFFVNKLDLEHYFTPILLSPSAKERD